MKFFIETVYNFEYDDIIKKYPQLKDFKIRRFNGGLWGATPVDRMIIEIKNLNELTKLWKSLDHSLILRIRRDHDTGEESPCLEIYDNWRE